MAKYPALTAFYKSKEWIAFRKAYIEQRMIEDNGLMDDYTGEWIERLEDVVLHHIIELTPDNVHDASIALNPDNIKQVTPQSHNAIHRHAGSGNKRVMIVYGPPMSGKTGYVKHRAWPGDLIVDMDSIYEAVSGLPRYEKPDILFPNVIEVANLLIDHARTRYGKWDNAWIIGGYPEKHKREKLARDLGAELIFRDVSKAECIARIRLDAARKPRESEWTRYIEKWFDRHSA